MYSGIQPPEYNPTTNPTGNDVIGNTFNLAGQGSSPFRASDSDDNQFVANTFNQPKGPFLFEDAAGNVMASDGVPAGQEIKVVGAPGTPSSLTITDPVGPLDISADALSSVTLTGSSGQLFSLPQGGIPTQISAVGSTLSLPAGTSSALISPQPVSVRTNFGTATAWGTGVPGGASVTVALPVPGPTVTLSESGLNPGGMYPVTRDGRALGTVSADASGDVSYSEPSSAGTFVYQIGHVPSPQGDASYLTVASDGGIFSFGAARFSGLRRGHPSESAHRGYGRHPRRRWLLAGGRGRRHLLLRGRRASMGRPGPSA